MTIEIGTRIADDDTEVPEGTILVGDYGNRYTLLPDGWHHPGGQVNPISHIGAGRIEVVGTRVRRESLAEYQQRLRTVTLGHAHDSGVGTDALLDAFEALDMPWTSDLLMGMWVNMLDTTTVETLPEGTLLEVGFRDGDHNMYGVTRKHGGYLSQTILGGRGLNGGATCRVIAFPHGTEFGRFPEPDDNSEDQIKELKMRAWLLGIAVKADRQYCGVYERAMARVGITQGRVMGPLNMLNDAAVRVPNGAHAAAVPDGTIVCRSVDGSQTQWTKSGRRYFSTGSSAEPSHFIGHRAWYYIHIPQGGEVPDFPEPEPEPEPQEFVPATREAIDNAPVGAVLRYGDNANDDNYRGSDFVRHEDGTWHVGTSSTHGAHEFTTHPGHMWHISIPVPEWVPATQELITNAPVGSRLRNHSVHNPETSTVYTRQVGGRWWSGNHSASHHPDSTFISGLDTNAWHIAAPLQPEAPVTYPALGAMINNAECRALPDGAVVRYSEHNANCWMVRDRNSAYQGTTGTRHLAGTFGEHVHVPVELLYVEGPMSIRVRDHAEMDSMPVGTVMSQDEESWTKTEDGRWDGSRTSDFVMLPELVYTHIPGTNSTAPAPTADLEF
jgi:hypothetical protein